MHSNPSALLDISLAKFESPPVKETVLGVHFDPLPNFTNLHLGIFWKSLGKDWSLANDAAAITPVSEELDKSWHSGLDRELELQFLRNPPMRLQVTDPNRRRMIQLQQDRLHLNWLGRIGGKYPEYRELKPEFETTLSGLSTFANEHELGDLSIDQWEVTYVNYLPKDTVWSTPDDWADLFPGLLRSSNVSSVVETESFGAVWHFRILGDAGRLHVDIKHGVKTLLDGESPQEALVMTLTARGPVDSGLCSYQEGLDIGHVVIVKSFEEFTSAAAHNYWGKYDGND